MVASQQELEASQEGHLRSSERRSADDGHTERIIDGAVGVDSTMVGADNGHIERINTDGVNTTVVGVDGEHSERNSANGVNCGRVANGVNSERNSANEVNYGRVDNGVNSKPNSANGINSEPNSANGVNPEPNSATDGGNSQLNTNSKRVREDAPKRGRAKMSRTELKMAPRSGRVEL